MIECERDSDCGSPHYTNTYCLNNDVHKGYITYTCLSRGEFNSSCRINRIDVLVDDCFFNQQCLFANFCPEAEECLEARCIYENKICNWKIC